jgi:hypothetical protein
MNQDAHDTGIAIAEILIRAALKRVGRRDFPGNADMQSAQSQRRPRR